MTSVEPENPYLGVGGGYGKRRRWGLRQCSECWRLIGWIMFSLYIYFLPGMCIYVPYFYTGNKLFTYECMHMYARRGPTASRV